MRNYEFKYLYLCKVLLLVFASLFIMVHDLSDCRCVLFFLLANNLFTHPILKNREAIYVLYELRA